MIKLRILYRSRYLGTLSAKKCYPQHAMNTYKKHAHLTLLVSFRNKMQPTYFELV